LGDKRVLCNGRRGPINGGSRRTGTWQPRPSQRNEGLMLIPTSDIADWRDLQDKVAMFFAEMGYQTKSPRLVDLAGRGRKEIDVYVEDEQASTKLC